MPIPTSSEETSTFGQEDNIQMKERSTFGADKAENSSGKEHVYCEILDTPADHNYEEPPGKQLSATGP